MKKLICLLLSLVLALTLLNGCSKKDKDVTSSDDPSSDVSGEDTGDLNQPDDADEPSDDTDASSDDQNAGDSNDQSLSDSNTDSTTNTSNNNVDTPQEQKPAPTPEEPNNSGEPVLEGPIIDEYAIDLNIYNSQEPISTRYRGASSTVWHAFGFMKNENSGRVYTDKMMNEELKRLTDSGIHYTRTNYNIGWGWNNVSGLDFNAERFGYFCDYARALQERDVSVVMQLGWHFNYISKQGTYSITCSPGNYFQGEGADRYGETVNYQDELAELDAEDQRMYTAGLRWGYTYSEILKRLKALGINNISHLAYFVEPSNGYSNVPAGTDNEAYVLVCSAAKDMLIRQGVANMVQHMGPNEGTGAEVTLLPYVMENAPELFDVITAHTYPTAGDCTNDVYYEIVQPIYDSYREPVEKAGQWGKAEFWLDEWNCRQWSLGQKDHPAYIGLQNSFTFMMAQQMGIDNVISWQLFDQLWTDNTSDGGEWENGIHVCGFVHSLFESPLPYEQFYTQSLFTRYQGYKNGTVYPTNFYDLCEEGEGIYIGSVLLEDGNWTITVLNLSSLDTSFYVHFDEAIDKTLYRHQLTTGDIEVTPDARLKDADKTYLDVQDIFYDSISAGSMAIYTSIKG